MESLKPLAAHLAAFAKELATALDTPSFYLELSLTGMALALAFLITALARRRAKSRWTALLPPILTLVYLAVFGPIAEQYGGGTIIASVLYLGIAWLAAQAIILAVRSRPVAYLVAGGILLLALLNVTELLDPLILYLKSTAIGIGKVRLSLLGLVHGIVILVVVFWLAHLSTHTLEDYLRRKSALSYSTRELIAKFFRIFVYFIALMITLSAMGVDLTAFAVFGGALGVGIGLGLQKITSNFVSGITLLMEKSIKLGDLIEVAGVTGWVRQLNVRYTLVETFDGQELLIPNEDLTTTRVTNWTYSNELARIEIKVSVAYESDAVRARELMLEAARSHPKCLRKPEPACFLREFGDNGLIFALNFWIANIRDGRWGPQSEVMFAILEKFKAAGIEIPYPHQVVQTRENK